MDTLSQVLLSVMELYETSLLSLTLAGQLGAPIAVGVCPAYM